MVNASWVHQQSMESSPVIFMAAGMTTLFALIDEYRGSYQRCRRTSRKSQGNPVFRNLHARWGSIVRVRKVLIG